MLTTLATFLLSAAAIVTAGVLGVRWLERALMLGGIGRVGIAGPLRSLAWVLPELAVVVQARMINEPILAVGVVLGAAVANVLAIGLLDLLAPAGHETSELPVSRRDLVAVTLPLFVGFLTIPALALGSRSPSVGYGRSAVSSISQQVAAAFSVLAFLLALRLLDRLPDADKPVDRPDPLGSPGTAPGSLARATAFTGLAAVVVVYGAPTFCAAAAQLLHEGLDVDQVGIGRTLGVTWAVLIGVILAIPDFLLGRLASPKATGRVRVDLPRAVATLLVLAGVVDLGARTRENGLAGVLFGPLLLTCLGGTTAMLFLLVAWPDAPPRARGAVLSSLALAGLILAVLAA
ncbi:MAG TPA: hypothetical protein VF590_11130 [Isosphaeraceae bacterium]|jgi:Ca2+/Na+ antiporter